jgi:hypothetical protein
MTTDFTAQYDLLEGTSSFIDIMIQDTIYQAFPAT